MCRFAGLAFSAAAMAALLLSVAQEVKITSIGCAPINSATCRPEGWRYIKKKYTRGG